MDSIIYNKCYDFIQNVGCFLNRKMSLSEDCPRGRLYYMMLSFTYDVVYSGSDIRKELVLEAPSLEVIVG